LIEFARNSTVLSSFPSRTRFFLLVHTQKTPPTKPKPPPPPTNTPPTNKTQTQPPHNPKNKKVDIDPFFFYSSVADSIHRTPFWLAYQHSTRRRPCQVHPFFFSQSVDFSNIFSFSSPPFTSRYSPLISVAFFPEWTPPPPFFFFVEILCEICLCRFLRLFFGRVPSMFRGSQFLQIPLAPKVMSRVVTLFSTEV